MKLAIAILWTVSIAIGIESAAAPYALGQQPSPVAPLASKTESSCAIDTKGIAEPVTEGNVQTLMGKYAWMTTCNPSLRSVLDDIYRQEKRDEQWAAPIEEKINAAASTHEVVVTGACHASLCRYEVRSIHPTVLAAYDMDSNVVAATRNTRFSVESIHLGTGSSYTTYFYSTVVPAAFVDPLRRKMGRGLN